MSLAIGRIISPGERKGLSVLVFFAFLSTVFPSALFLYILQHVLRMRRQISPITLFYLSLLFFDVVQGIAWIISIKWISYGRVVMGEACVTQAILKQFDATGTSMSILAMSWCIFHNYVIKSTPLEPRAGYIGLGFILIMQAGIIAIPNIVLGGAYKYYGIAPAGLWCWISDSHFTTKIVTQYLWYWLAIVIPFLTAVCYTISSRCGTPLPAGFLWIGFPMRGNKLLRVGLFSIDSDDHGRRPKWSLSPSWRISRRTINLMLPVPVQYFDEYEMEAVPRVDDTAPTRSTRGATDWKAIRLLLFPLSYLVLVAPFSVVRFIEFGHIKISSAATLAVSAWFALTGVVDVVLFVGAGVAFGIDFTDKST